MEGMEFAKSAERYASIGGDISANRAACDVQGQQIDSREPTMSETILKQSAVLHQFLDDAIARTEKIVSKLGGPIGEQCAEQTASPPSRGGVLGNISDTLDATEPKLRRLSSYLAFIARQI